MDYVPAKAPVLMGHHLIHRRRRPDQRTDSGRCPWMGSVLMVLIGGIFFGRRSRSYGALFASLRHKGQSIGEVIADTMGSKRKTLYRIRFAQPDSRCATRFHRCQYLQAAYTESGAGDVAASSANAQQHYDFHSVHHYSRRYCSVSWYTEEMYLLAFSLRRCSYRCLRCCWIKLPSDLSLETAWMVIVSIYITAAFCCWSGFCFSAWL